MIYRDFIKRLLDFIFALVGLLLLSPIFIILTLFLLIANDGKPFFLQKRPGKNERLFKIIKFKSMNDKKDAVGNLLPFDKRITKVGKFIRKYSLDEIPQLINVLIGDMSLVGPRPLLIAYLPLYNEDQRKRHLVRPGVTGWAQVNGRNTISWEQKFKHDVWYVENLTFWFDLKILALTAKKVIKQEGVNNKENLNMPAFRGSN